jgi:hypothetical protein
MEDVNQSWPSPTYPEGWYPLPDGSQERYWDGIAWTKAYRPRVSTPGQPQAFGSGAYGAQATYHGQAIASMVLGICSLVLWYGGIVTGVLGLIFGAVSLKHCQPRGPKRGRGMAIAGIVCSILALIGWVLILIIVAGASNDGY